MDTVLKPLDSIYALVFPHSMLITSFVAYKKLEKTVSP